jgi:hypothetical protein
MTSISPALLFFGCAIALLAILVSNALRRLVVIGAVIALLIAAKGVFIRDQHFSRRDAELMELLQPTWAGPCSSGERAAILKVNGWYYLAAEAGVDADSSCIDIRFWR